MREKILVIEDDPKISRLLEIELKFEGFDVFFAYDGKEGLNMAKYGSYDIILLDVMLPKMSGMVPIILGIVLLTKMIDISWLFTGKEDFKKITLRNTMVKVAGVISIFTFIKSSEDLYLYIFLIVIFDFLGQFVMWIPAKKFIKRPSFDTKIIKKNLHPIVLLFLPQVAISLYVVLDRTLLGLLGSYSDVGIYEQGQKLTSILLTVVSSLGAVMLPRVANLLSERRDKEAIEQ